MKAEHGWEIAVHFSRKARQGEVQGLKAPSKCGFRTVSVAVELLLCLKVVPHCRPVRKSQTFRCTDDSSDVRRDPHMGTCLGSKRAHPQGRFALKCE